MGVWPSLVVLLALLACTSGDTYGNPRNPNRSSLEKAFDAAFNMRVQDGTWARIFGGTGSGFTGTDTCPGPAALWDFPEVEQDTHSALNKSLTDEQFICGYVPDALFFTADGRVLLDTRDPGNPDGILVEWFFILGQTISTHYQNAYTVVWETPAGASPSDVLNKVRGGEYNAACGRWAVGGIMSVNDLVYERRVNLLSLENCLTFLQPADIWVHVDAPANSFTELISHINDELVGNDFNMCTSTSAGGGTESLCSSVMSQYTNTEQFHCNGLGIEAFPALLSGACDAVWLGPPTSGDVEMLKNFFAPSIQEFGTFFPFEHFGEESDDDL